MAERSSMRAPTPEQVSDWKRLFTDPKPWMGLISEILLRIGEGPVTSIHVGLPGSNAVFIVNDALIVKIYWPRFEGDVGVETAAHEIAERCETLRAPRLIAEGAVDAGHAWRYIVVERLPGRSLGEVRDGIPMRNLLLIAEESGEMIAELHACPVPCSGPLARDDAYWAEFLDQQIRGAPERHRADLVGAAHLSEELGDYLDGASPLPPADFRPTLIHCDLTADHLLVEERDGRWRITGLIDFGDVDVGHVDYEWIALHLDCFGADARLTRRFLEAYGYAGLDDRFARRMTAYSLLHRFATVGDVVAPLGGVQAVRSFGDVQERLWAPVASPISSA